MPVRSRMSSLFAHPDLPTPDPDLSVFINCPFDEDYRPTRDAIIFTIVCCGFHPRAADESQAAHVSRMERIAHGIFTSSYSVHDLSRYRGEGPDLFARLNMPLELGIAMGRQFLSSGIRRSPRLHLTGRSKLLADLQEMARGHRWLVLVPVDADKDRYISDLKAFDFEGHDGSLRETVRVLTRWLSVLEGAVPGMTPALVLDAFKEFQRRKHELEAIWGTVAWDALVTAARQSVPMLGASR